VTRRLDDDETQDVLHRMTFELQSLKGITTRAETAIRAAEKALTLMLQGLIRATDNARQRHGDES
jgi:hypothetical protein